MRILYATDGSEGARRAGEALARMPLGPDTRVTALHVLTRYVPADAHLPRETVAALRADEDARAREVLRECEALLAASGARVDTRHVDGHPARAIVEAAEADGADLIVTGALGLSAWQRALLGSVSAGVVKHAPCPVLVVKAALRSGPIRVLVATDGSADARHAIRTLCALPLPEVARVDLVYVTPALTMPLATAGGPLEPPLPEPVGEVARHFRVHGEHVLKEDAATLAARFADVRPRLAEGEPRRAIIEAAREAEADLIVLGSKGLSGIREFFLGSVSHKVLKHARGSVLVVPLPAP